MCIFQNLEPLKIFQYFFVSLKKKNQSSKKKKQTQTPNQQPDMEVAL